MKSRDNFRDIASKAFNTFGKNPLRVSQQKTPQHEEFYENSP